MQTYQQINNKFYVLILLLFISCSNCKNLDPYSVSVHYQYVIFKIDKNQAYNVYVENFLNIKNNTTDTLVIPYKDIEGDLIMKYKDSSEKSFSFMSNSDLKIAPLDSIDLNCAVDVKEIIKKIPQQIDKKDYKVYNTISKKYLLYSNNYEIIRTTKFGVFKEKYLK